MKRLIAAVLSICIALCAAGCGGENVSSTDRQAAAATESKTEASFTAKSVMQSRTDAVIAMTQAVTETSEETTTSESEAFTESETETYTEPEETTFSEAETTTFSEPETTTTTTTTAAPTTTTTTTMSTTTPRATTTKKTTTKPSAASSQKKTATVTTTKPAQTTTAPKLDKADTSSKLYYMPNGATYYDKKKNRVGTISAGCYYSGHYDPNYPGFVVIKYVYSEYLVPQSSVKVQTNAKILETAAIGQMGGNIWGQASCGPTAAAILTNYQLGTSWAKDDLILYCEKNKLNDQGSLRAGGGITAPNLIKMIQGYSGGKITASNVYGSDPTTILKRLVDKGERSIVVVQYTSSIVTHYNSGTHFVVICGYEYIGGALYFYYADPYYSYNGRSLLRVNASTLATSMNMVVREPRCIITVKAK